MIFVKYRLLALLIRGSLVQAHPEAPYSFLDFTIFVLYPSINLPFVLVFDPWVATGNRMNVGALTDETSEDTEDITEHCVGNVFDGCLTLGASEIPQTLCDGNINLKRAIAADEFFQRSCRSELHLTFAHYAKAILPSERH